MTEPLEDIVRAGILALEPEMEYLSTATLVKYLAVEKKLLKREILGSYLQQVRDDGKGRDLLLEVHVHGWAIRTWFTKIDADDTLPRTATRYGYSEDSTVEGFNVLNLLPVVIILNEWEDYKEAVVTDRTFSKPFQAAISLLTLIAQLVREEMGA